MISTVTNQGKTRWMIIDEAFNSDKLTEFLEALIKDAPKKVCLILDNLLRVHHSKPVKAWLAQHKEEVEVPATALNTIPSACARTSVTPRSNMQLDQYFIAG